jgi:dihydrofolate reductase
MASDSETHVVLVVAATDAGVIGRDGALPWHLPADLRRFKAMTLGKPILMGRRTFDSIGRPLPGRTNLVLTRSRDWHADGVVVVRSFEEALQRAAGAPELMVIGGAELYRLALPSARRIELTRVHADVPGDTFLPPFSRDEWREVAREDHPADERNAFSVSFVTLERVR